MQAIIPWATNFYTETLIERVREAGIVGQGGAAFPTYVKLSPPEGRSIDSVILNGCECEPFLTADYRVMLEAAEPVVVGAMLGARAVGAERIVIAVEDNKMDAVKANEERFLR